MKRCFIYFSLFAVWLLFLTGCETLPEKESVDYTVKISVSPTFQCFSGEDLNKGQTWVLDNGVLLHESFSRSGKKSIGLKKRLKGSSADRILQAATGLPPVFWSGTLVATDVEIYTFSGQPWFSCELTINGKKQSVEYTHPPTELAVLISELNRVLPRGHRIDWTLYETVPLNQSKRQP